MISRSVSFDDIPPSDKQIQWSCSASNTSTFYGTGALFQRSAIPRDTEQRTLRIVDPWNIGPKSFALVHSGSNPAAYTLRAYPRPTIPASEASPSQASLCSLLDAQVRSHQIPSLIMLFKFQAKTISQLVFVPMKLALSRRQVPVAGPS